MQYREGFCLDCKADKILVKRIGLLNGYCRVCNEKRLKEKNKQDEKGKLKKRSLLSYYRDSYAKSDKKCEECDEPLPFYSATFVSHILSRGSHPELALHPLNHNILCFAHHRQWETGDRKSMKINAKNQIIIQKLKALNHK